MDDPKPASSDKNEQDVPNDPLNQPYDDKQPETYVTPTGEPTTIAPMATPLSLQKPKSHSGRWIFRGVVVLLIAVLGAFGYWQWTEAQSAQTERESLQTELNTVKMAYEEVAKKDEVEEPAVTPQEELKITERADNMVKAIEAAHLDTDYVVKLDKVKGEYVSITTGMPNKDGIEVIFKNTANGLVQIAVYESMSGMTKNEAANLKSDYGFDAATFGLTVNP